jgi:hypothetical protein
MRLFESITPTLRVDGPGAVLDIAVVEYPHLKKVVVRGLKELKAEEIVEALIAHPRGGDEDKVLKVEGGKVKLTEQCPAPVPPKDWVARERDGELVPGLLSGGVEPALTRVLGHLFDSGRLMAGLSADFAADGTLTLDVDEGVVEAVEIRGVHPDLLAEVRARLALEPGRVFVAKDLDKGLERVHDRWPQLHPDGDHSAEAPELVVMKDGAGAPGHYHFVSKAAVKKAEREEHDGLKGKIADLKHAAKAMGKQAKRFQPGMGKVPDEDGDKDDDEAEEHGGGGDDEVERGGHAEGGTIEGKKLIVWVDTRTWGGAGFDPVALIKHTQVTGFAPGVAFTMRRYDEADRVNLAVDAMFGVNTRRPSRTLDGAGLLSQIGAQERVDWLVGPRVQIPFLHLAEVGAQFHTLTDTADRWRTSELDAYAHSAWMNRPDSEYFRRTGVTAFLTGEISQHVLVGAEYRFDHYGSLDAPEHVWTVFNRGERAWANPAIDEGDIGSVVLRAEVSSRGFAPGAVGNALRHPERSIIDRRPVHGTEFDAMLTAELADPSLGGDYSFNRLVGDGVVSIGTGGSSRVVMRLRAAGGSRLPLQKQEGLGGWDALRGYQFKEFRGDGAMLATVEYRLGILAAFADLGTVHQDPGWIAPRMGVGADVCIGDDVRLEAAWRTDERATAAPSVRLMFRRTF